MASHVVARRRHTVVVPTPHTVRPDVSHPIESVPSICVVNHHVTGPGNLRMVEKLIDAKCALAT
jgi:hypothetical protein